VDGDTRAPFRADVSRVAHHLGESPVDGVNYASFGREVADAIEERGLGNFTKRELDVLLLHLLEKHSSLGDLSNGDAGRLLRAPASRIRSLRADATLRYSGNIQEEFRSRLRRLIQSSRMRVGPDELVLVVEDAFTRDMLLAELKKKGSFGSWSFNSEVLTVKIGALLEVLVDQFADAELAAMRKELGATSADGARRKLREGGRAIFDKLKEKAEEGVATLTGQAITDAARQALPQMGAVLVRYLFS